MSAHLTILTVGDGDTTLTFDPKKPAECARAKKVVDDMLKRGFAILVEVGKRDGQPLYQRAHAFDPETAEYIIVGAPDDEEAEEEAAPAPKPARPRRKKAAKPKPRKRRVKADGAEAFAVGRTAGG